MLFNWKMLVNLATTLRAQAASVQAPEAYYRTIANRAYFGAYGHALDYAVRFLGYDPKANPDEHGRLRQHLRMKRRQNAADRLAQLREWRNDADYLEELPWDDFQTTADAAILKANEVFAILAPPAKARG